MGSLVLIEGPQERFVTVDWIKQFIHVDTSSDDERIGGLIDAAIARLDGSSGILGRALYPQTWRLALPDWPPNRIIVPLPPLISVTSVTYLDSDGVEQTLASDQYRVVNNGTMRSHIVRADGVTWPGVQSDQCDAVRVLFDAGYRSEASPEDNAVPESLRQAVVMMVQRWYDAPGEDIPEVVNSLVAPYKANRLGPAYGD